MTGSADCPLPTRRRLGTALGAMILTRSGPSRAGTLTPADVGAHGDGVTNDTEALQRLFDRAQAGGLEVRLTPGTYLVSRYLLVRRGLRSIVGGGGVIRCAPGGLNTGLLLAGPSFGDFAPVENCRIEGVEIDASGREGVVNAIFAANARRCRFIANRITGMRNGTGILVHGYTAGGSPVEDVTVEDNEIEGITGEHGVAWWGIRATAELALPEGIDNQDVMWRRNFRAADVALPTQRCTIARNKVRGGYYGICLLGARNCSVTGNLLRDNVRNITLQDHSRSNTVRLNQCLESQSSSIHLAFGASDNLVQDNRIETARAQGEALLQAYLGVERNRFVGNKVRSSGMPKYLAYCAIHAIDNSFEGNHLRGRASRAIAGLESAWDSSFDHPAHHARAAGVVIRDIARRDSAGNAFSGQVIEAESAVPALYLGQIGPPATALRGTRLLNNQVRPSAKERYLELVEQSPSALTGIEAAGNGFPPSAGPAQFALARGSAHFARHSGNGALDDLIGSRP
ncbi:putative Right-handed parallel beta-helix repeat-containing protein [Rubrivivax sp. A210]|uniref:right-handed parallel beta-helix repeat-containing protein n=1 Tax=Rubrivivax sp. A210 TaxID=2772301 RepID=UPI00191A2C64|nr:right-handed parallel beta-helix repeat-containing protein [Rubrivivax sp. A210]CAD5372614.1 putative Right-handed parallel beta-helix repeat-containing protein [Rubrivivax sp. A210]